MVWVKYKTFRLSLLALDDVLIGCKPFQGLEAFIKVVSIEKRIEMFLHLVVGFIIIPFNGCFFKGTVHALYLPIRPRVVELW